MPVALSTPRRNWLTIALLVSVALAIWLPRAFSLDKFTTTDEVVWLWRSANFYYSLGQRDFAATSFNRSPGVVTMWVETGAFLLDFPQYRGFGQGWLDKYALFEALAHAKGVEPHDLLVTSRQLMVLLNTALLAICFLYARKLFGNWPALVGFLLIAFDPFHSAITRLAHLDGPMGSFSFLSLLAFLGYVHAGRRTRDLLISAAAAGLAILAKIPGFILIPTVGLIALWDFWGRRRETLAPGGSQASAWLKGLIEPLAIWGVVLLVTIIVFFPAMWVKPVQTLQTLALSPIRFAERVVDKTPSAAGDQAEEQVEASAKIASQPLDYLLRYPKRYLWRITPLILVGLLLAAVTYLTKTGLLAEVQVRKAVLSLLLYVLLYTVFMTIPPKTSEKYYLPVYAALDLVAGIGWYVAFDWAKRFVPSRLRLPALIMAVTGLVLLQAAFALRTFPYYVTYFNPLLGGNRRADQSLMLGSGEGLDLAADYLNQKPGAEDLKVMSWYGVGPFSYYFDGEVVSLYGSKAWNAAQIARLQEADYLVVYVNQWKRKLPIGLFAWLDGLEPEQRIRFDGIELARIYNVKSFPAEMFPAQP
jgi:4-amino-4-deoxy-L-arabinose transferase-like glycosyltransferase